jgi:hypothetical protein
MAKMYPSKIPEHIRQNKIYRGEVQTYETLARLPDAFHVFYNPRVTAGPFAAADDRLIDFVVLHEQWGMLSIEVKAGKIRVGKKSASIEQSQYNSKTRKWKWASIDPYAQLTRAFWKLVKLCEADGVRYRIPALFCVVFPSTSRQQFGDQRYSLLAGIIFCADDLPLHPIAAPALAADRHTAQGLEPRRVFRYAAPAIGGISSTGRCVSAPAQPPSIASCQQLRSLKPALHQAGCYTALKKNRA